MAPAGNVTDTKISAEQLLTKESYADEFVCKLCHVNVVGCRPQLTKCSHLFCGDCLQQHFETPPSNQQAKADYVAPCPVCKTLLSRETDIFPVEKNGRATCAFLWRMIQGLKIKCNAKGGCCDWKGEYGSYLEHLQCGKCNANEPEKTEADAVSEKANESVIQSDEPVKDCPPSPSTCSEMLNLSTSEEPNTDGSHDEWSSEGMSDSGDVWSPHQDSKGQDLASLIQDYIHVTATIQSEDPSAIVDMVQSTPAIIAKPDIPPSKTAKSKKVGVKKQKQTTDAVTKNTINKPLTPQEAQAYQWQAARYQMAYAQQYQMALQAIQIQQYYQQARLAAGGAL